MCLAVFLLDLYLWEIESSRFLHQYPPDHRHVEEEITRFETPFIFLILALLHENSIYFSQYFSHGCRDLVENVEHFVSIESWLSGRIEQVRYYFHELDSNIALNPACSLAQCYDWFENVVLLQQMNCGFSCLRNRGFLKSYVEASKHSSYWQHIFLTLVTLQIKHPFSEHLLFFINWLQSHWAHVLSH